MKAILFLGGGATAAILFATANARGSGDATAQQSAASAVAWDGLAQSFGVPQRTLAAAAEPEPPDEIDVVDAHWMALTMWGEARGEGEAAMRAVGHVIDNRRRLGRHGAFATDTVSEAWQFSCWNAGDPNRAAIETIERLATDSREYRLWRAARRLADDILAGRSDDPTGGALFYHAESVSPAWSRGIEPVARIGGHLFFRVAR